MKKTVLLSVAGLISLGAGCTHLSANDAIRQAVTTAPAVLVANDSDQQAVIATSTVEVNSEAVTVKECPDGRKFDEIQERCETKVEATIKKLLPTNATLREIKPIVTSSDKPQTYLGIYVVEIKFVPPQLGTDIYVPCEEQTLGEWIYGEYHVFTYRSAKILSDRTLPDSKPEPVTEFPWKNTESNNHRFFSGPTPTEGQEYHLELTSLINLKDYTRDGSAHEFILYGQYEACGHTDSLVAGYDKKTDEVIFYPLRDGDSVTSWMPNFIPDKQGNVQVGWACGDHGSDVEDFSYYSFDEKTKSYVLQKKEYKKCPEDSVPTGRISQ